MFRDVTFNLFSCNKVQKPGKHVYDVRVSKLGCNSYSESIENFTILINCELTLNWITKSVVHVYIHCFESKGGGKSHNQH